MVKPRVRERCAFIVFAPPVFPPVHQSESRNNVCRTSHHSARYCFLNLSPIDSDSLVFMNRPSANLFCSSYPCFVVEWIR